MINSHTHDKKFEKNTGNSYSRASEIILFYVNMYNQNLIYKFTLEPERLRLVLQASLAKGFPSKGSTSRCTHEMPTTRAIKTK